MSVKKESFGKTSDGREVEKFTLENANGMKVSSITLGACITNIVVPDRNGVFEDVVLGYDDVSGYEVNGPSFGAVVGRYANRISGAEFTLDGRKYTLDRNNGSNCLHSGYKRFNHFIYDAVSGEDGTGSYVEYSRLSPDGEQNMPGNLNYSVRYTLTDDDSLIIHYHAVSDEDTILNLTNHSYFNIGPGGEARPDVLEDLCRIDSEKYTPVNEEIVPTGEKADVKGTPFDFTEFKPLGRDLSEDLQGYDNNFVLENEGEVKKAAELRNERNGRKLEVFTDMPGLQLYTAPTLSEDGGKGGKHYGSSAAVCFESQHSPNAINTPSFESPVIKAGEEFESDTIYRFSTFR